MSVGLKIRAYQLLKIESKLMIVCHFLGLTNINDYNVGSLVAR